MHNTDASLQFFHTISVISTLRKANLINLVNIKEVLVHLSKIYVVENNFGNEILSEFPKKLEQS